LKQNYDSVYNFEGGYAKVKIYDKYGLIDAAGNEVLTPAYDNISYYYPDTIGLGFIGVEKDGLFGFAGLDGQMNADFTYGEAAVQDRGTFAYIKDLTGKMIVISGLIGELPEQYADVDIRSGARAFVATNNNGQKAVIGLNGKELVPFGDYQYLYVNEQGTVALISLGSKNYQILTLDEDAAIAVEKPEVQEETQGETQEMADGTWTCSNGHEGNTGNFCPQCGEQRPLVCPSCGASYPNDGSVKFCPNCGHDLQQ